MRRPTRARSRRPINRASQHTPPTNSGLTPAHKRSNLSRTPLLDLRPNSSHSNATSPPVQNNRRGDAPRRVSLADRLEEETDTSAKKAIENISSQVSKDTLRQLFTLVEKDTGLQKQWWALQTLVAKINRLNQLSTQTQLVADVPKETQYTCSQILAHLRKDCSIVVAESESEINEHKLVFLQHYKFHNKRCTAIYIDLIDGPKDLLYTKPEDPHAWFDGLLRKRHSLVSLVPPKFFELINPWYSTEFEKTFAPRDDETAIEAARNMHDILAKAQQSPEAAKSLTIGFQEGQKVYYVAGICSEEDDPVPVEFDPAAVERLIARHRDMAMYMRKALQIALATDAENCSLSWGRCCQQAVEEIQQCTGINRLNEKSGGRSVEAWFRSFKQERLFENPLVHEQHGISFFLNNPTSVQSLREYGNNNLETLSIDLMHNFIHEKEIPRLLLLKQNEPSSLINDKESLLKESGLRKLCPNTVHNWMRFLGFKRDIYRKGFYTDNHERPDVVRHRIEYCLEYLKLEIRCYHWVQITPDRVETLKDDCRIYKDNPGYAFVGDDGEPLVEFHVDDIKDSFDIPELENCRFGGKLSVRKKQDEPPLMLWGQDEVVSHEKQQSLMTWYGSEGQAPARSKDKGSALHISGILGRELCWMPSVTVIQLDEINRARAGKKYVAEEAAREVLGAVEKRPFSMDEVNSYCFRWAMHPGVNHDGHWNCNYALIQLENTMDVVNVLIPHAEHIIYYDHSQGHKAKRKDGLDASKLNKGYGGKQPIMRQTVISETCLGMYPNGNKRLPVGALQSCVFTNDDEGPCWMSAEEQMNTKHDKVFAGEHTKRFLRTKADIYDHLKTRLPESEPLGPKDSVTVATLRELSKRHKIPLFVMERKQQIGWLGAPKGAFQLCVERGLIDLSNGYDWYKKDTRKDKDGNEIPGLVQLLSSCSDFQNELTMLEWVAKQYGWVVKFSPKCHPEIAGMGIEYDWATSKNTLNRIPVNERRGVEKFKSVILHNCFSRQVLTDQVVRNNARQQRGYIIGYLMMHASLADESTVKINQEDKETGSVPVNQEEEATGSVSVEALFKTIDSHISCEKIKRARKCYKRHRGIAIFESKDKEGSIMYRMPKKL